MYAEVLCTIVMALGMPNSDVACKYMDVVVEASEHYELEPELLISLIHHESRWTPGAVSSSGACGLTQVLPKYTKNPKLSCKQLKNPQTSIWAGAKALDYWVHRYGRGRIETGLCGYFAGFRCKGENKSAGGVRYSRKVRKLYRKILRKVQASIPGC